MATGKELARMMTCGIWKDNIESRKDFCNAQIYNNKGKPITTDKAQNETHCHARILLKQCPEDSQQLIAELYQHQKDEGHWQPEGTITVKQYIAEVKATEDKDISESTAKRFLHRMEEQGLLKSRLIPYVKGGNVKIWWKP